MKAEKLSPRPTGSMIVRRNLPAGTLVNNRNIAVCNTPTAASRPSRSASSNRLTRSGNGRIAGIDIRSVPACNRESSDTPPGTCDRFTSNVPSRTASGTDSGGWYPSAANSDHGKNNPSHLDSIDRVSVSKFTQADSQAPDSSANERWKCSRSTANR